MRKQEICFKGRLGRGAFHWRVRKRRVRGRKGDDGGGGARELETRMRKDGEKPGAEQRGTKARQSNGTFSFTI